MAVVNQVNDDFSGALGGRDKPLTKMNFIFHALQAICLLCGVLQLVIDPSGDGMIETLCVVASTSLVLQYLRRSRSFNDYPVSSLAILGLCATTQFMSLVAQTMNWKPLGHMLRVPVMTFSLLAGVQVMVVAAHWFVRHSKALQSTRQFIAERVVLPIGGFSVPSVGMIWWMAFFGAIAMLVGGVSETGNVGGKFFEALSFMAYLPYMIPLYYIAFGERYCSMRKQVVFIVLYALVIVGIGMARNVRQLMLIGPVQALFIYFIYSMQDARPVTKNSVKKLLVVLVLGLVALQFVADLATAMVINRDKRRTASPIDMVSETIATLGDRTRIAMYRQQAFDEALYANYDEAYIPNPVLARFSETKFHDNMFFISTQLSDAAKEDLADVILDKIKVLLPQNVLKKLNIRLDKNRFMFSMGDYYRVLHMDEYAYGGYATGSVWADVLNLFGWWSPVFVFGMLVLSFTLMDPLSRAKIGILNISPVALCASWPIFIYGLGGESLVARIGIAFREIPQRLILFVLAYWFFSLFAKPAIKVDGVSVHMDPEPTPVKTW